jgi:hypothetical protein
MTAEIVVLNRQAVALAADSAVTVGAGEKVFPSAEKIFAISDRCPVGAMVYGRADVMGVPWETVFKDYGVVLGQRVFDRLEQYAENFVDFLGSHADFFPDEEQRAYVESRIDGYFTALRNEIADRAAAEITRNGRVTDAEVQGIAENVIAEACRFLQDVGEPLRGLPEDSAATFRERYARTISTSIDTGFEKLTLSPESKEVLADIAVALCTKFVESGFGMSGIVVAGFGARDVYPSVWSCEIDGVGNDQVIRGPEGTIRITAENQAVVAPFAQREMVDIFMEGSDASYREVIRVAVAQLLTSFPDVLKRFVSTVTIDAKARAVIAPVVEDLMEVFERDLAEHRMTTYVQPVVQIVASLPKDELAAMAEALVNLTSFKQRVSAGLESVGGPIDVAVISRGDGLVWIRRKQYFRGDLNPQFMARYVRRESYGAKQAKQT